MSTASNSNFTRGAQLWAHNIRMILQGVRNVCVFGLFSVACLVIWRIGQYMTARTFYYLLIERYVQLKLAIGAFFYGKSSIGITFYSLEGQKFIYRTALDFEHKFWYVTEYGPLTLKFMQWAKNYALMEVMIAFIAGSILSLLYFSYRGSNILGIKKLRGGELVSVARLRRILKLENNASKIQISGLPLVKNTETQHILLTGTTGSGKTNMLNELLPQIRLQNQRAIIFDVTGSFVNRFFNPETDVLLNPLEEDSVSWLPWNDCATDCEFNALASAFVDGQSITSDKYWEEAAQKVLAEALKKGAQTRSITDLLDIIGKAPLSEFCQHFSDTFAAALVSREAEKGTASVRSTLLNKIERLKYLKDGGDFSIKNWVNRGQGWLFITAMPRQRDTLRPLVSAWIDIAIKGLLERDISVTNDKMWFILDELPALQKIPALKTGLAEGRKYGACFVAGIQNISQLEEIYERSGSASLLDMFNTRFYFAVSDHQIAEYASKSLGSAEVEDTKESLSYGSNTMRDGVNINSTSSIKPLVMPNQIKDLKPRTCYVKLPQGYPVTKLKVKLQAQSQLFIYFYKLSTKFGLFADKSKVAGKQINNITLDRLDL
jgi:type IV conjugative transfer system coupling protein TraD